MRYLSMFLMVLVLSSCGTSKKSTTASDTLRREQSTIIEHKLEKKLLNPGVNVFLGDRLTISPIGKITPMSKTFRDASGRTAAFTIDSTGVWEAVFTSPPDTLHWSESVFKTDTRTESHVTTKIEIRKKPANGFFFGLIMALVLVIFSYLIIKRL